MSSAAPGSAVDALDKARRNQLTYEQAADQSRGEANNAQRNVNGLHQFQMRWLRQVHSDEKISPRSFFVAYFFCDRYLLNPKVYIEVGQEDIAAGCAVCIRTIHRVTKLLARRGHLKTERPPGRGALKRYWLVLLEAP